MKHWLMSSLLSCVLIVLLGVPRSNSHPYSDPEIVTTWEVLTRLYFKAEIGVPLGIPVNYDAGLCEGEEARKFKNRLGVINRGRGSMSAVEKVDALFKGNPCFPFFIRFINWKTGPLIYVEVIDEIDFDEYRKIIIEALTKPHTADDLHVPDAAKTAFWNAFEIEKDYGSFKYSDEELSDNWQKLNIQNLQVDLNLNDPELAYRHGMYIVVIKFTK